jgi:hypothetical protein
MNERQLITVYKKDGTPVQINARPVVIEGFETENFYTHTNVDGEPVWNITDSEGHTIGQGLKWYDAALDAERNLKCKMKNAD